MLMLVLAVTSASSAHASGTSFAEGNSVAEPWCGWWWPDYHDTLRETCDYCPHMWQGGTYDGPRGDWARPIYDLDTRYFWRQGSARTDAQAYEHYKHRTTDTLRRWTGHCNGISCAQALVYADTVLPSDCGALTQEDLEGLLAELYSDARGARFGSPESISPGDFWQALRHCIGVDHKALVVDFSTAYEGGKQVVWDWPVYEYIVTGQNNNGVVNGLMTLFYEEHLRNTNHANDVACYGFNCQMVGGQPVGGEWLTCSPPPNVSGPPDIAIEPTCMQFPLLSRNLYLCGGDTWGFDTLMRVIDHRTIILDDAYMDGALPVVPPNGLWERRQGYADSCWAVLATENYHPWYYMYWDPRLGGDGDWEVYAYKTPPDPPEEQLTDYLFMDAGPYWFWYDQALPPFNCWRSLGTCPLTQAGNHRVLVGNEGSTPWPSYTYYDAVKLEYAGGSKDGGASSSTFALSHAFQYLRVSPNPVRRTARISYSVARLGRVDIAVYDVTGRAVLRATQGSQRAGPQSTAISVAGLPAGTYMARVSMNGEHSTCRFVVCR